MPLFTNIGGHNWVESKVSWILSRRWNKGNIITSLLVKFLLSFMLCSYTKTHVYVYIYTHMSIYIYISTFWLIPASLSMSLLFCPVICYIFLSEHI
jgi:hypothetical protein